MGWAIPWYSCEGSEFNADMGVTSERGDTFGLSVFLRDGESVFRTYFTSGRGVEALGSMWTVLDLTPLGRQETWEDSPPRWPLDTALSVVAPPRRVRANLGRRWVTPRAGPRHGPT